MAVSRDISLLAIKSVQGGGGGAESYNSLSNKPEINGVELIGNKTSSELGISLVGEYSNENLKLS